MAGMLQGNQHSQNFGAESGSVFKQAHGGPEVQSILTQERFKPSSTGLPIGMPPIAMAGTIVWVPSSTAGVQVDLFGINNKAGGTL